jgi:hypothetical protein
LKTAQNFSPALLLLETPFYGLLFDPGTYYELRLPPMVSASHVERAVQLAREAVELVDAGHGEVPISRFLTSSLTVEEKTNCMRPALPEQAASRNLREAAVLAPDHADVKAAFLKIRDAEETSHPLQSLCRRYVKQKDEQAGHEAVRYLRTTGLEPSGDVALDCLNIILAAPTTSLSNTQDDIITGLVRQSVHVRRHFAAELQISVTKVFDEVYERGDGAVVCLDTIVLERSLWQSEKVRIHCEHELFQLFIAKLMESGHDLDGRSLKGIVRLLAVDAESLQHLIDEDGFDVIMASLDLRLTADVRTQATLAIAKYLQVAGENGQTIFSNAVRARVARKRNDDMIIAFSAAAAVFPIVPSVAAGLFLTEGFVQSLTQVLERRVKNSTTVLAVLELFNAASTDQACRDAIAKHHSTWLSHVVSNGTERTSALAAVVLAKIRATQSGVDRENGKIDVVQNLLQRFKGSLAAPHKVQDVNASLPSLIEGLAYSSVQADVKEKLVKDPSFFKDLIGLLQRSAADSSLVYGGLTICWNVTKYLPSLSEEQKKLSELKAYANASKPGPSNELDDDSHVNARCSAVIDAGLIPLLVECGKSTLMSVVSLCSHILLELSKNPKTRGKLAQQGAVKLLLSITNRKVDSDASVQARETVHSAAHALARILISVNPSLVFMSSGFPQITSAIRPLVQLLSAPTTSFSADKPRDLLPVFESLLALTNLASSPDRGAANTIARVGWPTIEDLLLSDHTYIRRASCELTCNLMTCEQGLAKFADGSPRAAHRLHILLALADVDDLPTRRAAGGALAMLTEFETVVAAILDRERGLDILLGLCNDDDEGVVHRGVFCICNLIRAADPVGSRARTALLQKGGADVLNTCVRKSRSEELAQNGAEALKVLVAAPPA